MVDENKLTLEVIKTLKRVIDDLENKRITPWEYKLENILGRTIDDNGFIHPGDVGVRKLTLEFRIKDF